MLLVRAPSRHSVVEIWSVVCCEILGSFVSDRSSGRSSCRTVVNLLIFVAVSGTGVQIAVAILVPKKSTSRRFFGLNFGVPACVAPVRLRSCLCSSRSLSPVSFSCRRPCGRSVFARFALSSPSSCTAHTSNCVGASLFPNLISPFVPSPTGVGGSARFPAVRGLCAGRGTCFWIFRGRHDLRGPLLRSAG